MIEFALHLVTHFPPTKAKVEHLIAEAVTPEDKARVLVEATFWLEERIGVFQEVWAQHPGFAHVQSQPHNPYVVAVYQHPPGRRGETRSYMIGPLQDVTCPHEYQWGLTKLGAFLCIEPITSDAPVSWCRTLIISNSLITKDSWAFEARQVLRRWLPKPLRSLINKPRKYSHTTKADYAARKYGRPPGEQQRKWQKHELPDDIRQHTKAELWLEIILKPEEHIALSEWIEPMDFYRAATGKVHPADVEALIKPEKRLRQSAMTDLLRQAPEAQRRAKTPALPTTSPPSDWEQMRLL